MNVLSNLLIDKSIAIVGNAQSLFDKTNGQLIDSHDIVCRINKGIQIKNNVSQGTRTDIWAYGDFTLIRDYWWLRHNEYTIHLSKNKRPEYYEHVNKKISHGFNKTDFYTPIKLLETISEYGIIDPSSGLILIWMIMQYNIKDITLFGFDWKATPTWCNNEYDNSLVCVHTWELEQQFIHNLLISNHNLKLL